MSDKQHARWLGVVGLGFMALSVVACQPAEGPAERAGKQIDQAAGQVASELEQAGDRIQEAVEDARK